MERAKASIVILILIGLVLLLNGASAASNQSRQQNHQTKPNEQETSPQEQQGVSPAFYAAILGEFRALVSQEVAQREQQHADSEKWDTPMFWATIGLVGVGIGYIVVGWWTLTAVKRQSKDFAVSQRAQVVIGRPDGTIMKLMPPEVGKRLRVKVFFTNCGNMPAEQFFVYMWLRYRNYQSGGNPTLDPEPWRRRSNTGVYGPSTFQIGAKAVIARTVVSRELVTPEDMELLKQDRGITLSGKFQYFDGFGQPEHCAFSALYIIDHEGGVLNEIAQWPNKLNPKLPGYSSSPESAAPEDPI